VHGGLAALGMIPVLGIIPDLFDAGLYLLEGNLLDAGVAGAAAIPLIGLFTRGGQYLYKVGKWLVKSEKVGDLLKSGWRVVNNNIGAVGDVGSLKKGTYSRPSEYRKGVRDKAWGDAIEPSTGRVRDPKTGQFMGKDKSWDMGHKPGHEFRKHQKSAAERGIDRKQFLDEHNNPSHYRPELPSSNRSHAAEDMTDSYFGP